MTLVHAMLAVLALLLVGQGNDASAQTLDRIRQAGKIAIGVKTDYPPWGMLDPQGRPQGMEVDMANDIGRRLGVAVEIIVVLSSNRLDFLRQGRIDLVLATLTDTPERRQIVGAIDPTYYAASVALFSLKSVGLKRWEDLRGKPICAIQGPWYNRLVQERYGAELITFPARPEAEAATLARRCVGWLWDDTAFLPYSNQPQWAQWELALPPIEPAPWILAVPLAERDGAYGKAISAIVEDWHRTGYLLEVEKKWGIPQTQWLLDMNAKYKNTPRTGG